MTATVRSVTGAQRTVSHALLQQRGSIDVRFNSSGVSTPTGYRLVHNTLLQVQMVTDAIYGLAVCWISTVGNHMSRMATV